ncbi:TAM domain methyltransferase [Colletotrichum higginsianum]|uniref:TAM domain methyltransferase n=1 Tax=Colletotrichum higginsianum (strain IMI 349063) TaxID=759273 RepID=H1VTB9_COLHI|nr:TAM domain methyltransferase [Colletotrichum higginsianum]
MAETNSNNIDPNEVDREIEIAAEEDYGDNVSNIGSTVASSTTSVWSSILDHRIENGRTYHRYKEGKYMMPNDETENDRLDLQHHLFRLTFEGRLGNAPPIEPDAKVGRVLDLGCGTGIWAIDYGDEHPETEVLGIDLSPTQPEFTASNVMFEIDDVEEPWTYTEPFDYIHSRMMNSNIGDWDAYVKQCFDNLSPGGYLELNECDIAPCSDDGTLRADSAISKSVQLLQEASEIFGRPFKPMKELKSVLINAGFVDVVMQQYKWPTNDWPLDPRFKVIGSWSNDNISSGWEAVCMANLTRAHGWTREEVIVFMAQCRKEFSDRRIHAYLSIWSVYGRKPLASNET